MSIAKTFSAQTIGLKTEIISVEIDISNGLNSFSIVGMGDRAVAEAKDRISAAIKNSGYTSPKQKNQKVVISLAPADVRKEGPSFDLSMAIGYLKASGDVDFDTEGKLFLGELSLLGEVKQINGILPILCAAKNMGFNQAFIPEKNKKEASLAKNIDIYAVSSLQELIEHLSNKKQAPKILFVTPQSRSFVAKYTDMSSIRGNENIKRGLEIAAAGAHNVIMCGPPGTGKTMLAQSFVTILPELTQEQCIEVTSIHSIAKILKEELITNPPFRSPHHTASYPSIVGGGNIPKPGEITLAHRGVLFLDELPEFDPKVLEALRQPLEEKIITISRARGSVAFPAQCILIASMNPCPCGRGASRGCVCPNHIVESYKRRISGPITDRIDIWLNVEKVDYDKLSARNPSGENSASIANRVKEARILQEERFLKINNKNDTQKYFNSEMNAEDIDKLIEMSDESRNTLTKTSQKFQLSGRSFHRLIKVSRTIADLCKSPIIQNEHVLEAIQYRQKIF